MQLANSEQTDEIRPLTTLRFVAALYVFLFHIHIRWPLAEAGTAADQFLSHGAVGMSLFFMLSGFVLGLKYSGGVSDLRQYAYARFTRIYPVYVLAGLVTLPWLVWGVEAQPASDLRHAAQYVFIISINIIMLQAWFPQMFQFWNNGGSWSISVEAFFYAILPSVISVLLPLSSRSLVYLVGIFYVIAAISGMSSILFPGQLSFIIFYSIPIFRVGEFLLGVTLGILFARGHRVGRPGPALLAAVAALATYLSIGPNFGFTFVTDNFAVVPLLAMIIFGAASARVGLVKSTLSSHIPVYLGRLSYSFYSFQAFVGLVLVAVHDRLVQAVPVLASNWILAIVTFLALSAISAASYHVVEVAFRSYLNRHGKNADGRASRKRLEGPAI